MKRTLLKLMATMFVLSALAAACGPTPEPQVVEKVVTQEVEREVTREVEATRLVEVEREVIVSATPEPIPPLKVAMGGDIECLDPPMMQYNWDWAVADWVFSRLARWDPTMLDPYPDLAESWEFSDDGLTLTIQLRKGVKFHTGREFTADDVVWSWQRGIERGDMARTALELASVDSFEATGPYEFVIHFKHVDATFLPRLGHYSLAIVDKETAVDCNEPGAGTGPYKFVEWIPGEKVVLERFEDYWDPSYFDARPDEVILHPVTDNQTRLAMLKSGEVDAAGPFPAEMWEDIRNTTDLELVEQEFTALYYVIAFNVHDGPTVDKTLRKAIVHAINPEAILQVAFFGAGTVECEFIPAGHWAHTDLDCLDYDPEKAKELLSEAGYPNGEGLSLTYRPYPYPEFIRAGEIIQQNLADIGVDLKLEVLEEQVWNDEVWFGNNFQTANSWYRREPDPDTLFSGLFVEGGGNNFNKYKNEEVEALFAQGRATLDREERKEIYRQIQEILLDEVPQYKFQTNLEAWGIRGSIEDMFINAKGDPVYFLIKKSP